MNEISLALNSLRFNRERTIGLLDKIAQEQGEKLPQALAWRPGPGRAHVGWQLMHVGVTEEIFACERLAKKAGRWLDMWAGFRGGSTPADVAPEAQQIRDVLAGSREELERTLEALEGTDLATVPEGWKDRGLTYRQVLSLLSWHEGHHQGQAHITYNMLRASGM
jgi:uncharacterized damage-inducible protein DinB